MNNLCCLMNPVTRCEGCNTQWCKPCEETTDIWLRHSKSHPYQNNGTWLCSIAGEVGLSLSVGDVTTVVPK